MEIEIPNGGIRKKVIALSNSSPDFRTMLNALDSLGVAMNLDSAQNSLLRHFSFGVFEARLNADNGFASSVSQYLTSNKLGIFDVKYLECLAVFYARQGDDKALKMLYDYKEKHFPKLFPDTNVSADTEGPSQTHWGNIRIYLGTVSSISQAGLGEDEALFRKALALKRLQFQMYIEYAGEEVLEFTKNAAYSRMFRELCTRFPNSKFADDAEFELCEDCIMISGQCGAVPHVFDECFKRKIQALSKYPDSNIRDKYLISLIGDCKYAEGIDFVEGQSFTDEEIVDKKAEIIKKALSYIESLKTDFPLTPKLTLDSLDNLIRSAESVFWTLSVKPKKKVYKLGEPIELLVTFNLSPRAHYDAILVGTEKYSALEVSIDHKDSQSGKGFDESQSFKAFKKLAPGETHQETITILPKGSKKRKGACFEYNLTAGEHICEVTYLRNDYADYGFFSKEVTFTVK